MVKEERGTHFATSSGGTSKLSIISGRYGNTLVSATVVVSLRFNSVNAMIDLSYLALQSVQWLDIGISI